MGIVKPATKDDIDRAIGKATKAQVEWAKTTFAERRKVLKTMLKCVYSNQNILYK